MRLPSLGNNFISLFKDTSIAAVIAVPELTFQARKINNESFRVIEVWLMTSCIYIATCALIALALRRLETRFRSSEDARHAELSRRVSPRPPSALCTGS